MRGRGATLASDFYIARGDQEIRDVIEACDEAIEQCKAEEVAFAVRATIAWLTDRSKPSPIRIERPGYATEPDPKIKRLVEALRKGG